MAALLLAHLPGGTPEWTAGEVPSTWIPVSHVGDTGAPGMAQTRLSHCSICRVNQWVEDILYPASYLSLFQINK